MLKKFNAKIALLSGNGTDFRQGEKFDINMPADLDQFR
ncbi:MAG: hypothetical protein ACI8ZB_000182 [Desulforhopalus sp.]|jgi:hypothetical protein